MDRSGTPQAHGVLCPEARAARVGGRAPRENAGGSLHAGVRLCGTQTWRVEYCAVWLSHPSSCVFGCPQSVRGKDACTAGALQWRAAGRAGREDCVAGAAVQGLDHSARGAVSPLVIAAPVCSALCLACDRFRIRMSDVWLCQGTGRNAVQHLQFLLEVPQTHRKGNAACTVILQLSALTRMAPFKSWCPCHGDRLLAACPACNLLAGGGTTAPASAQKSSRAHNYWPVHPSAVRTVV